MTLKDIKTGHSAVVTKVGGDGSLRQHFLDMGIIPGEVITVEKYAPMGDPVQIRIHGYELTLRLDDAKNIDVSPCKNNDGKAAAKKKSKSRRKPKNEPDKKKLNGAKRLPRNLVAVLSDGESPFPMRVIFRANLTQTQACTTMAGTERLN